MTARARLRTMLTQAGLFLRGVRARLDQRRLVDQDQLYAPGSAQWLIQREIRYGGYVTNIPKKTASQMDPAKTGFLTGGDRMLTHGYAAQYAKHLARYLDSGKELTLVEIGILKGTGLAIWCDLLEHARVIGLDIDLGNFRANLEALKQQGAFQRNQPELFEFDQFQDNTAYLNRILQGRRVNVVIDDGCHADTAILSTLKSVIPHLAEGFVYFIEDNRAVHKTIQELHPEYSVEYQGELTVLTPR